MKSLLRMIFVAAAWAICAAGPTGAADAPVAGSPSGGSETEATAGSAPAAAETGKTDTEAANKVPVVLTKEEIAEKEARKTCKVDICRAFRNPSSQGGDIACNVIKSWRKEQLTKMVAKLKVSWPYGPVRCTADVKLKRDDLVKAMTTDKHTTQLDKHVVVCSLDSEKEGAREITFEFAPKVAFEKGKAVSAKMHWGKIEAPALIKSAMWTATAADNTVNMLSGTLTADINDFIANKCDEVKTDWQSK